MTTEPNTTDNTNDAPQQDIENSSFVNPQASQHQQEEELAAVLNQLTPEEQAYLYQQSMAAQQQSKFAATDAEEDYGNKITLQQLESVFWHSGYVDPAAEANIKSIKQTDNGFDFFLENDKKISFWMTETRNGPMAAIGFKPAGGLKGLLKPQKMTAEDAQTIVGLAKTCGWTSLTTTGTEQERCLLWLEAKRAGLEVVDFHPKLQSDTYKQWQKEKHLYEESSTASVSDAGEQPKAEATADAEAETAAPVTAEAAPEVAVAKTVATSKFAGDQKVSEEKQQKVAAKAAKKTLKSGKRPTAN